MTKTSWTAEIYHQQPKRNSKGIKIWEFELLPVLCFKKDLQGTNQYLNFTFKWLFWGAAFTKWYL